MMINPLNVRINHHNVVDILIHLHITIISLLHLLIESVLSLGIIFLLDLGLPLQVILIMILVVIIIMDNIHLLVVSLWNLFRLIIIIVICQLLMISLKYSSKHHLIIRTAANKISFSCTTQVQFNHHRGGRPRSNSILSGYTH